VDIVETPETVSTVLSSVLANLNDAPTTKAVTVKTVSTNLSGPHVTGLKPGVNNISNF